jgi:hypothetical protein
MREAKFSKPTKREALKRSGRKCEASGLRYGLPEGVRCNTDLGRGVHFDHDNPEANSKDASLDNCRAVCPACHRYKTAKIDIPAIAKTVRQQDKNAGIRKPSSMPCSRNTRFKRRMDGSVVAR